MTDRTLPRRKRWRKTVQRRKRLLRIRIRWAQHLKRLETKQRRKVVQRRRAVIAARGTAHTDPARQLFRDAQQDLINTRRRLDRAEHDVVYTRAELAQAKATLEKLRAQLHGNLAQRAWQVAGHLVGVMEQGGNNRGPLVDRIIRENDGDLGESWCGDFCAYCYRHAGAEDVVRQWASAWGIEDARGISITQHPFEGCLVNYSFGQGHIGLFGRWVTQGAIRTREGNTGSTGAVSDGNGRDGVYEKNRSTQLVRHYLAVAG